MILNSHGRVSPKEILETLACYTKKLSTRGMRLLAL